MKLSKEHSKELLESVRSEMVLNSSITIFELRGCLWKKYHRLFDKNFIAKMKNKIYSERRTRISEAVAYELAVFEDTIELLCSFLWAIIDDKNLNAHDKILAIHGIRTAQARLLDAKFNAGIFERQFKRVQGERKLTSEEQILLEQAIASVSFPIARIEGEHRTF